MVGFSIAKPTDQATKNTTDENNQLSIGVVCVLFNY